MAWTLTLIGLVTAALLWELNRRALTSGEVVEQVQLWQPGTLDGRPALAHALLAHLRRGRPRWKVAAPLDTGVDLGIEAMGRTIAVRLHHGLRGFVDLYQLVREVDQARARWKTIIVVVCGEVDPALRYQLEDRLPGRDEATGSVVRVAVKACPRRSLARQAA